MAALLILGDLPFHREETVYELRPGSEAKSGRDQGCGSATGAGTWCRRATRVAFEVVVTHSESWRSPLHL